MKKEDKDQDITVEADADLDDSVIAEENLQEVVKKLRAELKEEKKKSAENLAGWQRCQADFINAEKRGAEDKKSFIKFANENLVLEVLDVLDSFDRAFADSEKMDEKTKEGVSLIHKQLVKILEKHGVKEDNPLGQDFDPNRHEAIQMVPVENKEDADKVIEVMQKGYSLNDKVIRPAKVAIGQTQ